MFRHFDVNLRFIFHYFLRACLSLSLDVSTVSYYISKLMTLLHVMDMITAGHKKKLKSKTIKFLKFKVSPMWQLRIN